jgi:hypothetical protein
MSFSVGFGVLLNNQVKNMVGKMNTEPVTKGIHHSLTFQLSNTYLPMDCEKPDAKMKLVANTAPSNSVDLRPSR